MAYLNYLGAALPESRPPTVTLTQRDPNRAETLRGSSADEKITGGAGDTLKGGAGDDSYYLNYAAPNPLASVVELSGGGIDSVYTSDSCRLAAEVENLFSSGDLVFAAGNGLANIIAGGAGRQSIYGAAGNDVLQGGAARDTFVVVAGEGNDAITDFKAGDASDADVLRLLGTSLDTLDELKGAMTQVGADVVLRISSSETLTFRNTTIDQFTANNFQLPLDQSLVGAATFTEDFNSLSLYDPATGTGRWKTSFEFGGINNYTLTGNGEKQIYTAPGFTGTSDHDLGLNPFSISGGVLTIRADKAPPKVKQYIWNYDYTSGELNTKGLFTQQYGYFEMRADVPEGRGFWPAFWLYAADGSNGELDVVEQLGRDPNTSYSFVHDNTAKVTQGAATFLPDPSGFHTWGMLWTPQTISFYLDGLQVLSTPTSVGMHSPMHMILNLALGGPWAGDPDGSTKFPADLKVDYVHVFALSGDSTPPPIQGVTVVGTDASETLRGGGGPDTLDGRGGDDFLLGFGGADTLIGGAGGDSFNVETVGDQTIENPGEGADTVNAAISWTLADNVEYLTLTGTAATDGTGNTAPNTLRGNDAANALSGLGGGDILYGKGGDDRLDGGTGNDTLQGDAGADSFTLRAGGGQDRVLDFVSGTDHVDFYDLGSSPTITQVGADTVIAFTTGEKITLVGVTAGALGPNDLIYH